MLKNYFLIALRSFRKDKTDTLISIASLIIGLVSVILIAGYLNYSTQFEKSYSNHAYIYRLISMDNRNDYGRTEHVPLGLGARLTGDIPEIIDQSAIQTSTNQILINNQYIDFVLSEVNSSFFSIFNFKFQQGNPQTALNNPSNIVLTASTAQRLFNTTQAVGKSFITKDGSYIISGIVEDLPQNSFLQTEAFCYRAPKPPLTKSDVEGGYNVCNAFIFLNKKSNIPVVTKKINQICKKYGLSSLTIELQPVSDIHLYSSNIKGTSEPYNQSDIKYIYVYGCIGMLLLIIGCINFINLTIARNMERTMEMGIRKVMGAQKKQIILQILIETGTYFFIACIVAFLIATFAWHQFALLSNIQADISFMLGKVSLIIVFGVCILSCLLSGLYPAIFLSGILPVTALKKGNQHLKLNFSFRKTLIAVQLTISIVLVVATIVVRSQLNYLNNKPLGFNKYNLISFTLPFLEDYPQAFKNELLQNSNISAVSLSSTEIGKGYSMTTSLKNPDDLSNLLSTVIINADADLIPTLQIPLLDGRIFSNAYPADLVNYDSANWTGADPKRSIIVSKSLVNALHIKDPIGKVLDKDLFLKGTIIGVLDDFNATSFKTKVPLIAIRCNSKGSYLKYAYVRINAGNTSSSLAYINRMYKKFFPQEKFDFHFIDERIASQYATEYRLTQLINTFTTLAIVLLGAGLFSLVSLVVRKRTKEIGIRKILGASVTSITVLIGKEFLWLIILALVIGSPVAYMVMTKWLQGYAYRTDISGWFFAIAGAAICFVAFASVGIKSIRAAIANPVKSLRAE